MLATAFDWLENVAAVSAIVMYPGEVSWLPGVLVFAKKCKLGFIVVSNGAMFLAVLAAAGTWVARRIAR
jgi:hypothetical protein